MATKIAKTTYRLLNKRLQQVLKGEKPRELKKRQFFYLCREAFQKEWGLTEVDYKGKNPYVPWGNMVNKWALNRCSLLGKETGRFWDVLSALNIWPHERGVCYKYFLGGSKEVLVSHKNRDEMVEGCSFVVVLEKQSIAEDLFNALVKEGYRANVIAMGGHDTGTVQAMAADINDLMEQEESTNFFVLSVHDYDLDGAMMVDEARRWFPHTIDCGLNREFFTYNGLEIDKDKKDWGMVETVNIEKNPSEIIFSLPEYNDKDREFFLTEKTSQKSWKGHRIEIDNVFAKHDIKPFVNYIKWRLEDVPCWDLTRIGVEEQELEEPENHYEDTLYWHTNAVRKKYDEKTTALSKQYNAVLEIVKNTMTLPKEYSDLRRKHWIIDDKYVMQLRELKSDDLDNLRREFKGQMEMKWKDSYQEKVDEEINEKLKCWEDDITTAKEDIENRVEELQEELNTAKEKDKWLTMFKKELGEIDFGEDEVDKVEIPDPVEELDEVIKVLMRYKLELEGKI